MKRYVKYLGIVLLFGLLTANLYAADNIVPRTYNTMNNTFVLDESNVLWVWGDNRFGQFGTGAPYNDYAHWPTRIMTDVTKFVTNETQHFAIKKDGSLWQWGDGLYKAVKVMENVKDIQVAYSSYVALKNDGTIWTWGYDKPSTIYNPIKLQSNVEKIEGAGFNIVALKKGGTVIEIQTQHKNDKRVNLKKPITKIKTLATGVKEMSYGDQHVIYRTMDGVVWDIGRSVDSKGNWTRFNEAKPKRIMSNVKQLFSTQDIRLALKHDNTLWAWGLDDAEWSENSQGTRTKLPYYTLTPVKIADNVKTISTPKDLTVSSPALITILKNDGTAWLFKGDNDYFFKGTMKKLMDEVVDIYCDHHTISITKKNNELWCYGDISSIAVEKYFLRKNLKEIPLLIDIPMLIEEGKNYDF